MGIFLDSGSLQEVAKYMEMGIIRGVTTNPTILLKDGVTGGLQAIKRRLIEIAEMVHPYPLSVEVTTNDKKEMTKQARDFATWADNIVVKIPVHGPHGELDNLEVVHLLESRHKVHINVTAMMNAQQCFLAAMADASYVSIFGGRVNDMGYNCIGEISKARRLIDAFHLKAKIIIGSSREVLNIVEWFDAGAHIVTVVPKILQKMILHPYTKETVQQFLEDAKKADSLFKK